MPLISNIETKFLSTALILLHQRPKSDRGFSALINQINQIYQSERLLMRSCTY
ncbi:MAG: hypothetical protein AAF728_16335 [Cyanobacteria bacterium P01_D01_bin.128]